MRKWVSFLLLIGVLAIPGAVWAAFVNNGDGTVTDTVTGLMWQQGDSHNDAGGRTWENALSYCEGSTLANKTDWRLPNIRELQSLVDDSRDNPAIDPVFNCRSSFYWSGTTAADDPGYAWIVLFYGGNGDWGSKYYSYYVRCVRGGHGSFGTLVLDLPVAADNPSRALLGNVGGKGPGRVNSWFDHAYPNYGVDNKLTRWDGAPVFSNGNIYDCTQGQSCYNGHNGIDFSHNKSIANEDVYAAAPGTVFGKVSTCEEGVSDCPKNDKYGNQVWINHGNGYATRYTHLQENQVYVDNGQYIGNPSSTPLGKMGNTGNSKGTHLHFGVYFDQNLDGKWSATEVIDPYGWYGSGSDPCSVNETCVTDKWMWNYPMQSLEYIDPGTGVTISTPAASTTVEIPAGALSDPVTVELQDVPAASEPATGFFSAGWSFVIKVLEWLVGGTSSFESSLGLNATLAETTINSFAAPVTVTMEYTDEGINHLKESELTIFHWNETTSQYMPLTTQVDTVLNKVTAETMEAGRFDLQAPLLCAGDVSEPNDVYDAATAVAVDGSLSLQRFDIGQDEDWFYFDGVIGKKFRIQVKDLGTGVRAVVALYDSNGATVLATAQATAAGPAVLEWRATHDGAHFLRLSMDTGSTYGCGSTYNLSVKRMQGALAPVLQLLMF